MKKTVIIIVIILAVLGFGWFLASKSNNSAGGSSLSGVPAAQNDSVSNNFSHVPQNGELVSDMKNAGLEPLSSEGTVMHIHQHLDIMINGQTVAIPADIGVSSDFISAVHTHDTSGVIHIESPVKKDFILGQFFKEWNINFSDSQIGNYKTDQTHKLIVAVNGMPISNAANYALKPHDEIEVWYGSISENPTLIKSYDFSPGL